jgi:hypothetical protein
MNINRRATGSARFLTIVIAAVLVTRCGASPTAPTTASVSGVALSMTSLVVGASGQGTVSLTAAASTNGANISLTSSAPAVATVQPTIMIPAGSFSATFNVAAVASGTATITASLNGGSRQSATFTVTASPVAPVSVLALRLSALSVVGGVSVTGTVILTAEAPAGGTVVSLSAVDPLTVPPSVTVVAGLLSATFPISTRAVDSTLSGTVTGSYGGTSAFAALSVTPSPVATASFGVSGPTESDTCTLTNSGNTLNCTFDGSTSTALGTIIAWTWTYGVVGTLTQTTSGPTLTMPGFSCSLMPPPPFPAGPANFTMTITLTIHDSLGNVASATATGVRLLPQGTCGF